MYNRILGFWTSIGVVAAFFAAMANVAFSEVRQLVNGGIVSASSETTNPLRTTVIAPKTVSQLQQRRGPCKHKDRFSLGIWLHLLLGAHVQHYLRAGHGLFATAADIYSKEQCAIHAPQGQCAFCRATVFFMDVSK